ncbi:MAG TPA: hypothetical protein VFR08_14155, partial [Candidatus Angelobacter sp.]|nr:hypothetical protein [Candidatus Angelobacter sp.]
SVSPAHTASLKGRLAFLVLSDRILFCTYASLNGISVSGSFDGATHGQVAINSLTWCDCAL